MPLTLHVQLLGGFSLAYGDDPVTAANTQRLQSLLAYLILHGDAPQRRQHVEPGTPVGVLRMQSGEEYILDSRCLLAR